jgi:hypothetical protein
MKANKLSVILSFFIIISSCLGPSRVDSNYYKLNIKSITIYDLENKLHKFIDKDRFVILLKKALENKNYIVKIGDFPRKSPGFVKDYFASIEPKPQTDATMVIVGDVGTAKLLKNEKEIDVLISFVFAYYLFSNKTGEIILNSDLSDFNRVYRLWDNFEVLNEDGEIIYRTVHDLKKGEYSIYGPNAVLIQRFTCYPDIKYCTAEKEFNSKDLIDRENKDMENTIKRRLENLPPAK